MMSTLYLWDFADTLFPERWEVEKSGVKDYEDYLRSLGKDPAKISAREYEEGYEIPMRTGLLDVNIADGFREVLSWTRNNAAFTTGNREQLDWRAEQLQRKYGFDVREHLPEVFSTFDYGNTNIKTVVMYRDILQKVYGRGYNIVVYTDNDLKNCRLFQEAATSPFALPGPGEGGRRPGEVELQCRVYHILDDQGGLRKKDRYWETGSLHDLLKNEKELHEN